LSLAAIPMEGGCAVPREPRPAPSEARTVTAGPWAHVEPPVSVPAWIDCSGYSGVFAYSHRRTSDGRDEDSHVVVRAVAFPDSPRPGYAVIVDLLINEQLREQLRQDTGVDVKSVNVVPRDGDLSRPMPGIPGGHDRSSSEAADTGLLNNLSSPIVYRDWTSGE